MPATKTIAAAILAAALAFAATDLSAAAQSSLTNDPGGPKPPAAGAPPRRAVSRPQTVGPRMTRAGSGRYIAARSRPLTVRPAAAPASVAGPGVLVTGPASVASGLVALPFRGLNGIFPATGDVATNPLVIVGAPLRAAADIAQVPFRIIGAPFGGTTISTY